MKKFAWILGIIAIAGTVAVGASWLRARKGASVAQASLKKALKDCELAKENAEMNRSHDEQLARIDNLQIENDDLDIRIAEMKNESPRASERQLAIDQMRADADEDLVNMDHEMEMLGPTPSEAKAQDRADASLLSLNVYRGAIARDQQLAYALGVLWLAFGFAVALSNR